ncbi:helix-turn-helix domain-containing protein [Mucilaginibacter dorajii]|uniref:HTH cro/C1-type domain-containing protein n=1 Tax=Mucilaginibacter dorajii TaxID=692994 RepID=A0ABP7QP47_9SPHI|nr:helix-turn-helix domain-containing protein [Mucilaginibacter dorajii]MCS3733781.1 lambda repressor-like predicted transcriptional regulator [Mucilaginibacter dorajii]
MDIHHGQIIEMVIRREGYSISELARLAKVNRRSVYYWFNQQYLKTELIYQIGVHIKHDFSVEFPHLFTPEDFKPMTTLGSFNAARGTTQEHIDAEYWKDKYLDILEKYNQLLIKTTEQYISGKEIVNDDRLSGTGFKSGS